jgi:PAS domain S-box-containing protein
LWKKLKLEKQNNLAQSFFDRADVLMIAIDCDGLVTDINEAASAILGCSRTEARGKNWFDNFVAENEREADRRLFHDMLNGSLRHMHTEYSLITRGGEERTFNFHNILVSDEEGKTLGVLSSGDDVTNRRRSEKASRKVENRLQVSLDHMIEGCQIIDFDWRYVYLNEAAARQGRKMKEELLGYTMMQVYPGIDRTEMFSNLRNCMTNRVPRRMENEFTFPDGSKGWFELYMEPVPEGVLILSIDITKSKAIEAELSGYRRRLEQVVAQRTAECAEKNEELTRKIQEAKKTEEALKLRATILDNAKEAIFLVNNRGDFVYANGAATEAYGYGLDEFLNMNLRALLSPKDTPALDGLMQHITEKGQISVEMVHLHKSGAEMAVGVHYNLVRTAHGQFIVIVIQRLFRR